MYSIIKSKYQALKGCEVTTKLQKARVAIPPHRKILLARSRSLASKQNESLAERHKVRASALDFRSCMKSRLKILKSWRI